MYGKETLHEQAFVQECSWNSNKWEWGSAGVYNACVFRGMVMLHHQCNAKRRNMGSSPLSFCKINLLNLNAVACDSCLAFHSTPSPLTMSFKVDVVGAMGREEYVLEPPRASACKSHHREFHEGRGGACDVKTAFRPRRSTRTLQHATEKLVWMLSALQHFEVRFC